MSFSNSADLFTASEEKTADSILVGLNPAQQEAARTLEGPVLVVAGPGSGKTRMLMHRIAYLLATERARPSEILALTFTNKAAREMRSRIDRLTGPAARYLWMGTFHSIFARIMRMEGERIGYGRDFSIYDTDDSERGAAPVDATCPYRYEGVSAPPRSAYAVRRQEPDGLS